MSIHDTIDNEVKANDVVLFMKGTPQFPMCGFSGQVVQILDYLGVPYKGVNVLENDEIRQGIKDFSNWPTIPQLYVKGEFVGGCDIVREMFQAGELQTLLKDKGVAHARAGLSGAPSDCGVVPGNADRRSPGTVSRNGCPIRCRRSRLLASLGRDDDKSFARSGDAGERNRRATRRPRHAPACEPTFSRSAFVRRTIPVRRVAPSGMPTP